VDHVSNNAKLLFVFCRTGDMPILSVVL